VSIEREDGVARTSAKAGQFTESVIRETFRLAAEHGAINLGQGFPDYPCPPELKAAACAAITADDNQYPMTFGTPALRAAIAAKTDRTYPGWTIDPDTELCVTCGATEALVAVTFALLDPGDEVVLFEPWYENYRPNAILSGAVPRLVRLREPDWEFDEAELRAAFGPRTKAVFLCHPNNPTGKVYRADELALLAELCVRWDAVLVVDSIYEHIHYLDPAAYLPPALVPGLEDRTVTVNALSKTYAVTGWRVGWTVAAAELTASSPSPRPPRCRPRASRRWGCRRPTTPRWPRATGSGATCCVLPWSSSGSACAARTAPTTCCATSPDWTRTVTASRSPGS
jgi:aspartate/methionine/tyrosine aminotransferase